jgi:molecular chaperone DnaJ
MAKNFYETLGVSKNSTEAEIKSSYRKLARQHHPDIDKSAGAAEKFKEISEAYQVLSDPQKRQRYDQFGEAAFQGGAGAAAGNPFEQAGFNPFGNGGFSYSWSSNGQGGPGFSDPMDLFEQIFGMSGFAQEFAQGFRRRQTFQMTLSFDEAVQGVTKEIEVQRVEGNHNQVKREKMTIKVPAGVDEGTRMRFGDVDIVFRVRGSKEFERQGYDIYSDVTISLTDAVLGTVVDVKTVHGKVKLKIPAGTQPDSLIRIKGEGVPTLRGSTGDHYVRIKLEVPKSVSGKEKELYEEIADLKSKKKSWF